jgi:hypothetical protein
MQPGLSFYIFKYPLIHNEFSSKKAPSVHYHFLWKNTPIFKGKLKSRKNRENTPVLKVYFKINIFQRFCPVFKVGIFKN